MANNYSDMTGVLFLKKSTPVIRTLFGAFELNENYPGNGEAYIANIAESTSCSWDSISDNIRDFLKELNLKLPDDAEDTVEEHLYVLAEHFGASDNYELSNMIENNIFDGDADLDSLLFIARAFDDGHGLTGFKAETSWSCDRPRLFEFGGSGEFRGIHFNTSGSSSEIIGLGARIDQALEVNDIPGAAKLINCKVQSLLSGINNPSTRLEIQTQLVSFMGKNH